MLQLSSNWLLPISCLALGKLALFFGLEYWNYLKLSIDDFKIAADLNFEMFLGVHVSPRLRASAIIVYVHLFCQKKTEENTIP